MRHNQEDPILVEIDGVTLAQWLPWHFDHCYNNELNRAGVLRAETIAPEGGLTGFADGIQIYNDLSSALREKLDRLCVVYTLDLIYSHQKFGLPKSFREIRPKNADLLKLNFPRAIHPVVWTRSTGEKVVHMSPYGADGFEGLETPEGAALFRELWAEIEGTIRPYYHRWSPTDMLVWDNWRMLHQACGCDPKYDRVMHRTTIKGDYGLGRWETPMVAEQPPAEMM
jgi:taurine dioxygenase